MTSLHTFRLAAAALYVTAAVAPGPAAVPAAGAPAFHLRLERAEPADGDTVAAPAVIRLHFSERPSVRVTRIRLLGPSGVEIPLGSPRLSSADPKVVEAEVTPKVAEALYRVSWRTASADGHPISGEYTFIVRAAGN